MRCSVVLVSLRCKSCCCTIPSQCGGSSSEFVCLLPRPHGHFRGIAGQQFGQPNAGHVSIEVHGKGLSVTVSCCFVQLLCFIVCHCLQTPHDQLRLRALVSGVKSGQVSVVLPQEWKFPHRPWIDPDITPGVPETLCVCTGLSKNPHIRAAEASTWDSTWSLI